MLTRNTGQCRWEETKIRNRYGLRSGLNATGRIDFKKQFIVLTHTSIGHQYNLSGRMRQFGWCGSDTTEPKRIDKYMLCGPIVGDQQLRFGWCGSECKCAKHIPASGI